MESITALEKVKNPVIALIGGILLGGAVAYYSFNELHEKRIKLLETAQAELDRQLASREKIIAAKDAELDKLKLELSGTHLALDSEKKSESSLRGMIAQLDKEIEKKKLELARKGGLSVNSYDNKGEKQERSESDSYSRVQQELQALNEQRNLAKQKLIGHY